MKTKHTPAPWFLICGDGADFTAIAARQIPEGSTDFDAEVLGSSEWLRVKPADLLLMATAPELLDALVEVIAISDRKHDAWDRAKAAIAKATGHEF